ncbi:MAG: hypothetical protein IPL47_13955 [Phyllobacteriaceae bacterium]|nr:hypothetical protein [Phyllobacteriaceae bacterium]
MKRLFRLLAAGLVSASWIYGASGQAENPAWVEAMSAQAAQSLQCEVAYLINMREFDLGSRHIEEARLQCVDGRRYDASRATPDPAFTFAECKEQVC